MIIYHHLGLGDHFICFGLVMELTKGNGSIYCKEKNLKSVTDLYHGTNIKLIPIKDDNEVTKYDYKIGFNSECENETEFGTEFYAQAKLDYKIRWKYKPNINRKRYTNKKKQDIVICDSLEHKINIDGYRPTGKESIFDYIYILENAKEIHVIESSFKQLLEFLKPKGKLFYHFKKDKSWRIVPSKHNYIIIND